MSIRRFGLAGLVSLCAVIGALGISSASAMALLTHPFTGSFGPEGLLSVSEFSNVQSIAVDQSTGDVYVYDAGAGGGSIYKFNAAGEPVRFSALGTNVIVGVGARTTDEQQIAVDSSNGPAKGDIYVANGHQLLVYGFDGDPEEVGGSPAELNGEVTTEVPGAPWGEPCGVAVDAMGNVYVGLASSSSNVNEYAPSTKAVVNDDYVSSLWDLNGEICNIAVDPEGNVYPDGYPAGPVDMYAPSQFSLTNVTAEGVQVSGAGSTLAASSLLSSHILYVNQQNLVAEYETGAEPKLIGKFGATGAGALSGASFGVASNAADQVYVANGTTVEMFGPREVARAQIDSQFATDVTATSASLGGEVDPAGADTTYHFEYGTENCREHSGSCVSVPSSSGIDIGSSETDQSIGTHLQGLAPKTTYHYRIVANNTNGTVEGSDNTFTTQAAESELILPDDRAYEMVSPPNKDGAEPGNFNNPEGGLEQAAEDGDAITYVASNPIGEAQGNVEAAQIISTRSADGWSSQDIATPHSAPSSIGVGSGQEYRLFAPDLAQGLVEPEGTTALSPYAPANERNIYLWNMGDNGYQPLILSPPSKPLEIKGGLRVQGASRDLSHVVITSPRALVSPAIQLAPFGEEGTNIYEWTEGNLQLVSMLPNGEPASHGGKLGDSTGLNGRHAVSADGSHIIWSDENNNIYIRDMAKKETVFVGSGYYETAASDGSKIFFLKAEGGSLGLFEFDIKSRELIDLTAGNAGVAGVIGASEDGADVYFVGQGISPETGRKSADNLYLLHDDGTSWAPPKFIATLASTDAPGWGSRVSGPDLTQLTSQVSPNGRYVAFMSSARLTGYDNRDAASGDPDVEVYLYDSAGTGQLVCASCDPSGARPNGELDEAENSGTIDLSHAWSGQWLAASIRGWVSEGTESALYQPRYLSNDGRLFFNSKDSLVAHDTDGTVDVYEYEPDEVGGCQTDGCVSLISAGTGSADSSFVDASSSGDDVFFLTRDRLLSQDYDNSYDIYDAHVCSAGVPCIAPVAVSPPPCTTGDSCKAAPSPQPAIFGAPSSATFSGAGSLMPSSVSHVVKPKKGKPKKDKHKKHKGKKGRGSSKHAAAGPKGKKAKRSMTSGGLTGGAVR